MATQRNFIKQFWKNRQMVGSVSPSTRSLGKKMVEDIDFENVRLIVELGSGTGVFTDIILSKMHPDARLLVFELNDDFVKSLRERIDDSRVEILHESAEFIKNHLSEDEKVDLFVSSLPLMNFSNRLRINIVRMSHNLLKAKGKFVQFQYSLQSKKLLEAVYSKVSIKFVLKNLPPAFIYTCKKN